MNTKKPDRARPKRSTEDPRRLKDRNGGAEPSLVASYEEVKKPTLEQPDKNARKPGRPGWRTGSELPVIMQSTGEIKKSIQTKLCRGEEDPECVKSRTRTDGPTLPRPQIERLDPALKRFWVDGTGP